MTPRSLNDAEKALKIKVVEFLELDRVRLLLDQPFIGAILIRQNFVPVIDWRCPSISTDGQNIFVNPEFYMSFSPAERLFWLAHCIWHTVYMHSWRRQNRDKELFDLACDMEVNSMLFKEKFKIPENVLLPPPKYRNLNAEQIYELLSQKSDIPNRGKSDEHLEYSPQGNNEDNKRSSMIDDENVVEDCDYNVDFGDYPEEKIREKVIEAAIQYEKKHGNLPANIEMMVESFRSGGLNWKELLAQFVTRCFGGSRCWLPPNRRYIHQGLYLQSRRSELIKATLAIDTSGSTVGPVLQQFADELLALIKSFGQYELTVICCDAKIQSVETFSSDDCFDISKIKFKGGGGTSFIPVFEYIESNIPDTQLVLFFTDGAGRYPQKKPSYPVLWVMPSGCSKRVKWGEQIEIKS